jgi:hypothetical protein
LDDRAPPGVPAIRRAHDHDDLSDQIQLKEVLHGIADERGDIRTVAS